MSVLLLDVDVSAKDPQHGFTEAKIQDSNNSHHDDDEYQHNGGVIDQLFASGGDNLIPGLAGLLAFLAGPFELLAAVSVTSASLIICWDHRRSNNSNHTLYKNIRLSSGSPARSLLVRPIRCTHAQGRQDSNLQPAVLETAALPIAPLPLGIHSQLMHVACEKP